MPGGNQGSPVFRTPGLGPVGLTNFSRPFQQPTRYTINGVTRDSAGEVLASCLVKVFNQDDIEQAQVTSSDVGVYSVGVNGLPAWRFYVVAYKAGSPDVSGTTVNTLVSTAA